MIKALDRYNIYFNYLTFEVLNGYHKICNSGEDIVSYINDMTK